MQILKYMLCGVMIIYAPLTPEEELKEVVYRMHSIETTKCPHGVVIGLNGPVCNQNNMVNRRDIIV